MTTETKELDQNDESAWDEWAEKAANEINDKALPEARWREIGLVRVDGDMLLLVIYDRSDEHRTAVMTLPKGNAAYEIEGRYADHDDGGENLEEIRLMETTQTTELEVSAEVSTFYHVTDVNSVESILREGLRGSQFEEADERLAIFGLSTNESKVLRSVAKDQIWPFQHVESFAVIAIDRNGISGEIEPDRVAEWTASLHVLILQEVIAPEFLKLDCVQTIVWPDEGVVLEMLKGCTNRWWSEEEWKIAEYWFPPYMLNAQRNFEESN